jgi:putative endonuclease
MGKDIKQRIGKYGEMLALEYLERKGYSILGTNVHSRFGEIDIIALSPEQVLVFCEVKTRTNNAYESPERAIDVRKLQKMWKTMKIYLAKHPAAYAGYRVDSIALSLNREQKRCIMRHCKAVGRLF